MLCRNLGPVDRALRAILGLILISLTVVGPQSWWGLVGLLPLLTAFAGSCPAYTLFGLSTCKVEDRAV